MYRVTLSSISYKMLGMDFNYFNVGESQRGCAVGIQSLEEAYAFRLCLKEAVIYDIRLTNNMTFKRTLNKWSFLTRAYMRLFLLN